MYLFRERGRGEGGSKRERERERERPYREREKREKREEGRETIYIYREEKVYIKGEEVGLSEEIMKPNTDEGGWGVGVEP